jgi:hypothetical protein
MLAVGCGGLFCSSNDFEDFPDIFDLTHQMARMTTILILPAVIQALHARITELDRPSALHLLPAHERLSSDLRTVCARNSNSALHWLGHGAIINHSLVSEFLLLWQILNCLKEEVKKADHYFSVLRNRPLETWFDQGIELGVDNRLSQ